MDGKVFSKETKDLVVSVIDDVVKVPVWAEPFDGIAFRVIINFIDKEGDKIIPDTFDANINAIIQKALSGGYEEAAAIAGEALDDLIDVPYLEDEIEKLVFVDGARFVVRLIQNWIEKKKSGKI